MKRTSNLHERPMLCRLVAGVWALAAIGCYSGADGSGDGSAESSGGTDSTEPDSDSATDGGTGETDGDPLDPLGCGEEMSASALRRLSAEQYRNTLRDLFAPAGFDVDVEASMELDRIPVDQAPDGLSFGLLDTRVSEQHARAYYRLADRMASVTTADDEALIGLAGSCATDDQPSEACLESFLDGFGRRAYRRPLSDEERSDYLGMRAEAESGPELFRAVVFRMLLAPTFVYHVQTHGEGDDEVFALGGYDLASRLSYHFWQSMPDDALFDAAEDGSLLTDEGYLAQVERVFEDPRTQARVDRFYDEWLQLGWLTEFPDSPAFETLVEGTNIGDTQADHLAAAQQEIHALTRYYTFETEGSLADLFLSQHSFTQSEDLAALYGVEAWDGSSEPPTMPAGQRAGLLTRTAFLLTGSHETHPVHRGAVIRRRILCEDLPAPDPSMLPDGALDRPPVTGDQTTRERYEAKTADAACAGCHVFTNPAGFILEQYDAVGRYRTEERIIDEVTGDVLATLPIDSAATPSLAGDNDELSTGLELSQAVVDSGRAEGCFATQYFRATFGRAESQADACTLEAIETALVEDQSIREALRAVAITPAFRARRVF